MEELTDIQRQVYNIIMDCAKKNGEWPSYRLVAKIYGSNHAGVFQHIVALRKKGYAEKGGARLKGFKFKLEAIK